MQTDSLTRVRDDSQTENEPDVAVSLAARVQRGEKTSEAELIARYSRGLFSFIRHKTNDGDLADDLHQETFCIVLKRLRAAELEHPSHLAGFIHATAKNLVIAHFRKQARRKTEPNSAAIDSLTYDGLKQCDAAMRDEQAEIVRALLDELHSRRDRELLQRFYLGEEDKHSICMSLDLSEKHFSRVLLRARERFKALLLKNGNLSLLEVAD